MNVTFKCDLCMRIINPYLIPIISLLGILGNGLCIVTVLATKLRKYSANGYLVVLFTSDNITLIIHLVIKNNLCHGTGLCRVCIFVLYFTTFFSVWILTAFTTERFLVLAHPWQKFIRVKSWKTTNKIIFSIFCGAVAFSIPWVYVAEFRTKKCVHREKPNAMKFFIQILVINDSVISFFIPTMTICIFNFWIAKSIRKSNKRLSMTSHVTCTRASLAKHENSSGNEDCKNEIFDLRMENSRISEVVVEKKASILSQTSVTTRNYINITLLYLSVTFILCNAPFYITLTIMTLYTHFNLNIGPPKELLVIKLILEYIYLLNFCLNFLLYSISSRHFRQCFKELLVHVKHICINHYRKRKT